MAYSHLRLRRTLALVRILVGFLFVVLGAHKISSWDFAKLEFPQFVWDAAHGNAVGFYGDLVSSIVWSHPSGFAVLVGLTELFIGVGLLLGLAVRPASLLGMFYVLNLMLATWMTPGPYAPLWRYLDNEAKLIALFLLFLLFGIGHAGENWGLGALYHHHRLRKLEEAGALEEEQEAPTTRFETYSQRYGHEEEVADNAVLDHTPNLGEMEL